MPISHECLKVVGVTISANCQFGSVTEPVLAAMKSSQKTKRRWNTWLVFVKTYQFSLRSKTNAVNKMWGNKGHRYKNRWHVYSLIFRLFSVAASSYCYQIWVTSKNRSGQSCRKIKDKQLFRNEDMQCGCSLCLQIRSDTLITAGLSWNGSAGDLEGRAYMLILQSSCQCMPSCGKDYYPNNCICEMCSYPLKPP